MPTESLIPSFRINYLTEEQYAEAASNGSLNEDELYMTPDSSESSSTLGYTYGTEDLVAGESTLDAGKLYFVYE